MVNAATILEMFQKADASEQKIVCEELFADWFTGQITNSQPPELTEDEIRADNEAYRDPANFISDVEMLAWVAAEDEKTEGLRESAAR